MISFGFGARGVGLEYIFPGSASTAGYAGMAPTACERIFRGEPIEVCQGGLIRCRGSRQEELVRREAGPLVRLEHVIRESVVLGDLEVRVEDVGTSVVGGQRSIFNVGVLWAIRVPLWIATPGELLLTLADVVCAEETLVAQAPSILP